MAVTDTGLTDSSGMNRSKMAAASKTGLAVRSSTTLNTVQDALVALTARYRADEVLTAVKHFPAREAVYRAMPAWVRPELIAAYRAKKIEQSLIAVIQRNFAIARESNGVQAARGHP